MSKSSPLEMQAPSAFWPMPELVRPPASAVSVRAVSKRFSMDGVSYVLKDVSLEIAPGEFLCMLGASGCGKTSLMNLVAGIDKPTTGAIEIPGGRAALMFQESALLPWLTAGQNVSLALKLRGLRGKAERRAEASRLLTLVRLRGADDKRPHELSGGMRQRVAIARALAQDSKVLLMDEPFAALDAVTRDVLHEELIRIWQELGLTIVFVTHNVREAVRLGQRVILLSSRPGRIIKEWQVTAPQPRRIEDREVTELSVEITDELRREIARHAH